MRNQNRRKGLHTVLGVCAATALLSVSTFSVAQEEEAEATTLPQLEQKFKKLRKRVKQLETEVGELRAKHEAVEFGVVVDCAAGDSINNVLQQYANESRRLNVFVDGTCTEAVVIERDNVILSGGSVERTVIQAPEAPMFSVSVTNGAHNVRIENLTLRGPHGAAVNKNAHALFRNIVAEQTNLAMVASDNGTMEITQATIRNSNVGVYAARGGVALVSNSTIEQNVTGLLAFKGGTVNATSVTPDGVGSDIVLVRNNTTGGVARSGGVLELSDTTVTNNTGVGLLADTGSAIHFFNSMNGNNNFVVGNVGIGVSVQRTAAVVFNDASATITGNSIGIFCAPNGSGYVAPLGPGTVTANRGADILNCAP